MRVLLAILLLWNVSLYASEPMMLKTESGNLYGELEMPAANFNGQVALIVAGSGPTDRNGNSLILSGKNNSLKMLAQELAMQGIATLRYDKRGIGLSKDAGFSEAEMTFELFINDAKAWVELLSNDARFTKIYTIGHSQGALIASVLATEVLEVKGTILISGTSQSADEIIEAQLKGLPEGLQIEAKQVMESLRSGKTVPEVTMFLASVFRPSVQPFLISWMKYQPKDYMTKTKVPMLVVHGENDIQVPDWHADSLAVDNANAKVYKVTGMNHVLKDAPMQRDVNLATYGNPDLNLSAGLVDGIAGFIKAN
jgi:pimeloyl-ACP methyl ester carboxylesterase